MCMLMRRKGLFACSSATVYYQLTTFIPDAIDIAIPRKAKMSTIPGWPPFNIHYYMEARYNLGITNVSEGKNRFQIYDIEKNCC